jgi:hypothetical protein
MDAEFPHNWPMWAQAKERAFADKLPLGIVMQQLSE